MQPPSNDSPPPDGASPAGPTSHQPAQQSPSGASRHPSHPGHPGHDDCDARGIAAMMGRRHLGRPPAPSRAAPVNGSAGLVELVERQVARARRLNQPFALLCLVADQIAGEGTPDHARRALDDCASRLCSRVRATDHVARYGPHHFGVLLPEANDTAAWAVALRLLDAGSGTYRVGEHLLELRLRAGHAAFPQAASDGAALVYAASATTEPTAWDRRAAPAEAKEQLPLDWGPWWR
jgi:GGDEF domain-containing protein